MKVMIINGPNLNLLGKREEAIYGNISFDDYLKTLNNDLEKIVFDKYPRLKKIKSFLLTIPNTIFVRMSGSGSSIIAYFHSKKACGIAYSQFKRKFNSHWCIISKTI